MDAIVATQIKGAAGSRKCQVRTYFTSVSEEDVGLQKGIEAAHHGNCKYRRDYTAEKMHFSVYKAVYGLSQGEVMLSVGK